MPNIMTKAAAACQAKIKNKDKCLESCIDLQDIDLCSCCRVLFSIESTKHAILSLARIKDAKLRAHAAKTVISILE